MIASVVLLTAVLWFFWIMVFCVNVFLFKKWFRLFLRVMILVLFAKFFVEGSILAQDERWRRA